jgi:phosphatidylethanolamine/phosphatidyl-N-methylethanolamine N-methyltransferase
VSYALFLKRLLANPTRLHAIAPSSRALARAIVEGLDFERGAVIAELGCGTGPFTRELEPLCAARGWRYLGVELDPELTAHLRGRHPRLAFVCGDAAELPRWLADRDLPRAAAVISGLPLAAMSEELQDRIVGGIAASLRPGGIFRHFTYLHYQLTASARRLRGLLGQRFATSGVRTRVARNLPPALILEARTTP